MGKTKIEQDEDTFIILLKGSPMEEYEDIIEECCNTLFTSIPSVEFRKTLMRKIVKRYLEECCAAQGEFFLTEEELTYCKNINNPLLKRIFYCLLIQAKLHPHKNGWVQLDWPNVLTAAFGAEESKQMKIEILSDLREFGLDMRVIGSKNPVLCFNLSCSFGGEPICCLTRGQAREYFDKEIENG